MTAKVTALNAKNAKEEKEVNKNSVVKSSEPTTTISSPIALLISHITEDQVIL